MVGVFYPKMSAAKRTAIFIDGSNLYHKLKKLKIQKTSRFDYAGLCRYLASGSQLAGIHYYVGVILASPHDPTAQRLQAKQMILFNHLRDQGIHLQRGFLMKSACSYHEKGVDVNIAVDMLVGAYEDMYDKAILISSDTDLIPAIHKVRNLGKKVQYIGFIGQASFAMKNHASFYTLLTKEEVSSFSLS